MNINWFRGVFALFFCLVTGISAASESVTGGIIGGLFPSPKFLKGTVENKIYTTPDKSFRIAIPYGTDENEWRFAVVREGQDADKVTWVIFGPGAFDRNFYHAVLIKQPLADSFEQQMQMVYKTRTDRLSSVGGPFRMLTEKRSEEGARQFGYGVFENEAQFLVLSGINAAPGIATIQLQIPKAAIPAGAPKGLDDIRKELVAREYASFNAFFDSFVMASNPQ